MLDTALEEASIGRSSDRAIAGVGEVWARPDPVSCSMYDLQV
jgi:hypothetical protein